MLCQMWPLCLHINWEHVSAAADAGCVWTSGLGRPETKSEMLVGGRMALGGDSCFDPLPCLAQDYKASLLSSWLILRYVSKSLWR